MASVQLDPQQFRRFMEVMNQKDPIIHWNTLLGFLNLQFRSACWHISENDITILERTDDRGRIVETLPLPAWAATFQKACWSDTGPETYTRRIALLDRILRREQEQQELQED